MSVKTDNQKNNKEFLIVKNILTCIEETLMAKRK